MDVPGDVSAIAIDGDRVYMGGTWQSPDLRIVTVPVDGSEPEESLNEMLFLRPGQPYGPQGQGSGVSAMVVQGSTAYTAVMGGLLVLDVSAPRHPQVLSTLDQDIPPGSWRSMALAGSLLLATDGRGTLRNGNVTMGLALIDVQNPGAPLQVGTIGLPDGSDNVAAVSLRDSMAFIAARKSGLLIYNISNPTTPELLSQYKPGSWTRSVVVHGDFAYLSVSATQGASWLQVIDIADLSQPRLLVSIETPGVAQSLAMSLPYLYLADREAGLRVYDITVPLEPRFVESVQFGAHAVDVTVSGSLIAVWGTNGGLLLRQAQ